MGFTNVSINGRKDTENLGSSHEKTGTSTCDKNRKENENMAPLMGTEEFVMDLEILDIKIEIENHPPVISNMESYLNYNSFSPELGMTESDPLDGKYYEVDNKRNCDDVPPPVLTAMNSLPSASNNTASITTTKAETTKTKLTSTSAVYSVANLCSSISRDVQNQGQENNNNIVNSNTPAVVIAGASSNLSHSKSPSPMLSCSIGYGANGSSPHWMIQVLNVNSLPFLSSIESICAFADFYTEIRQISQNNGCFEFNTTLTCDDHPHPPLGLMQKLRAAFQHQHLWIGRHGQPCAVNPRCTQILWTR